MRELLKSMFRFSWGMSLFGMRQMATMLEGREGGERAGESFDEVAKAAETELGEGLGELYRRGDRLQRRAMDATLGRSGRPAGGGPAPGGPPGTAAAPQGGQGAPPAAGPAPEPPRPPAVPEPVGPPPALGDLGVECLVALGGVLSSGAGSTALHFDHQVWSFPAQVARCLGLPFRQPLLQPPGLGNLPGFQELPVIVPDALQTTFLAELPPRGPFHDLCLPGLTLERALEARPRPPAVHRDDAFGTLLSLAVAMPALQNDGSGPAPTPLEAALALAPALVLVELGYQEVVEAAVDPGAPLPEAAAFGERYRRLVSTLTAAGCRVVALTVPDPVHTACLSGLEEASRVLKVPADWLAATYDLADGAHLTPWGLMEIGCQLFGEGVAPLAANHALRGERVADLGACVEAMNREIRAATDARSDALHFDLHALAQRLQAEGAAVGERRLGAGYLGGLYTLNGYTAGATAHALVACEILACVESAWGARAPRPDVEAVLAADPVAAYRAAEGPGLDPSQVPPRAASEAERRPVAPAADSASAPAAGALPPLHASSPRPPRRLELPPGREQVLPLSRRGSYFGDGLRPIHTGDPRGAAWGAAGSLLFGGLALVDSHLAGELRLRFDEPQGDEVRFTLDFGSGFEGNDTTLSAPWLFRMPFRGNRVDGVPGQVSSGVLNLATGEVRDLVVYARYLSGALVALVGSNPGFPQQPLSFPGQYGTARARFHQRDDGLLDLTFYGSTFVPLGPEARWPLPFRSASGRFATVPAAGTCMHPHLRLTTREVAPAAGQGEPPDLPTGTVRELVLLTHNTAFGDAFTLHASELGGPAVGRSHLLGRLRVQFGAESEGTVPVAVRMLPPGGTLLEPEATPLDQEFPGRLSPGGAGHDAVLRFPLRSYFLDAVTLIDDPFDPPLGLVDLTSGELVEEMLHRGFIGQNVFYALVRVEPRTPRSSFLFRGPARFQRGPHGGTVYRHKGEVHIPYPPGFRFPAPDLATGYEIDPGSALDPYLWLRGAEGGEGAGAGGGSLSGDGDRLTAPTGEVFSYRLSVSRDDPAAASFEYENHSQRGRFRLHRLVWLDVQDADGDGTADTASFTGLGTWRKEGVLSHDGAVSDADYEKRLVAVQVSTARGARYVSIQVQGGVVSNVNTPPARMEDAEP